MIAADVELDDARQLNDRFGVVAVLKQRVFDGLCAVDEEAAKQAVLFARDPVAAAVSADKDHGGCGGATRGRFDELHVVCPFLESASRRVTHAIKYLCGRI